MNWIPGMPFWYVPEAAARRLRMWCPALSSRVMSGQIFTRLDTGRGVHILCLRV